ncbi:MAG: MBL fold metallo-hydrolase [Christensenellaceae bacterium]|nr:MBL fold metallo-hydrolase [Christensenellaceae bacterium]MEA5066086.1 MBL fold metallo-hydrolase [Eubacteriales bacterium]MEA5069899.1 MBL fold metallo-hydrolase [Christensenellaceae bacterium]
MTLDFAPLFSGSSGNAIYLRMDDTRILIDAGLSGSRVARELERLNVEVGQLDALLITHEHADHVAGAGILSRRHGLPIYATAGTWQSLPSKFGAIDPAFRRVIEPGQNFYIGTIDVMPFAIPHDAAQPVGYAFEGRGAKVAVATDLGCLSEKWIEPLAGCDLLLLESNHDVDMLKAGRYPYELKRRILGARGHLSNEDAGRAAVKLYALGVKHIILGHLSGENNFPELAWRTVADVLEAAGIRPGDDIGLDVARRDQLSGVYRLAVGEAAVVG